MINVEITPNNATLLYVLQNNDGHFTKAFSLEDAQKKFKKLIRGKGAKYKAKHLSVFLCLQPMSSHEAFSEVRINWMSITFETDKVILLQQTTLI